MKKLVLLMSAAVALALSGVAVASNGNPHGAFTAKFNVTYVNAIGGTWTCKGERIANKNVTKDEEECTISDPSTWLPQGQTVATPSFHLFGIDWFWNSDYDGQTATTVTYVTSGGGPDGTAHVKVMAQY
jgi:hypothetical protein